MENDVFRCRLDQYYNLVNNRLVSMIPEGPNVVLDLGCGAGKFGLRLKELKKARELIGVEIFEDAAEVAAEHYEKVYHGDLENMNLDYEGYFDFVVCGDVIEHLRDPWAMLRRIHGWLRNEGHVLVSIPNVRHWRILRNLVLHGTWDYVEAGILDQTHLRFFTRKSLLKTLEEAGFHVERATLKVNGMKQKLADALTLRMAEEFLAAQIVVLAKKT